MHCSTMEPRYYCLYMMLRNEHFKHPNPQNVEKREYFEDLQKINPFLLKSEGILDSYDLDL